MADDLCSIQLNGATLNLIIDTHVHLYKSYNKDQLWPLIINNLSAHPAPNNGQETMLGILLTDREHFPIFQTLDQFLPEEAQLISIDALTKCVRMPSLPDVYVFAGRQINTSERLEVACIGHADRLNDGMTAADAIGTMIQGNALPILNWALGKWMFERGKTVTRLLNQFKPYQMVVGDTSMRPEGFADPRPLRLANENGYCCLAGSDPLPDAQEFAYIGTYATCLNHVESMTTEGLIRTLRRQNSSPHTVGRRNTLMTVLRRNLIYRFSKSDRPVTRTLTQPASGDQVF